ncbi:MULTISPECIES: ATP-dependent DNA ligase [unclassified Mesorhizobium]|uniref:ATP-dependent DNA ligase n=1 Tax=unclassified Mesorhizobium TaxID=325217 RepID=UPI000FD5CDA5|nr:MULTISPECIES: ATP-dependent DNA ligase [unclassified Mesorhizobium]RUW95637.1 ATP-dependent DNA ligase [Mesorhizobium sp. M8A.F.Ca.ET.059.01.1.1]TGW07958.1 ATP-dependent DNA ligase [Mesorhizobium sp. M2D.F.Ca.ET.145.01.1.1]TGP95473.1 ATP-dependent DNA ligase [Mesorhizobium sp. M8A.F.Ca.ET.218.01.1.1]TGT18529.1 ATP-dependent DNA ligase [Mesorhizobium sp. M8A.F.Ca.ET.213.01.1.1]TGT89545.1 ATP-dependent DNA ligase [Mesorhizobium sp. M8A.F.Ca.ET.161.01.1.1]
MRLKFIEPLMPTLVEKPPEGDGWTHEVKFDGYRSLIIKDEEGVRIFTRRGLDWTAKYRDLAKEAGDLDVDSAIIDGEVIVLNDAGLSDFGALRKAISRRQHDLYFVAFDLLHINGLDIRDMPLEERREILAEMIPVGQHIQFSQALPGEARVIFHLIDQAGMEGMVSKRRDSKYRSGMSTNWLKAKCYTVEEYGLLGVEREPGKPAFALMADRKTGRYVGSAFINSSRAIRERLWERVQEHAGPPPKGMKRPSTQWVKPGIIARVKHLRGEEDLRHASLQDFREE